MAKMQPKTVRMMDQEWALVKKAAEIAHMNVPSFIRNAAVKVARLEMLKVSNQEEK